MASLRRVLHHVFKIADREATIDFYTNILGMRVLRHEEFEEGCKAACNGKYDGNWSKTMVGYGDEDHHFVVELTYNYGIENYRNGNEFRGLVIENNQVLERAKKANYPIHQENDGRSYVVAPGNYRYYIIPNRNDDYPVKQVIYSSTDLAKTKKFWVDVLDCSVLREDAKSLEVFYVKGVVRFEKLDVPLDRGEAFGRVAFSCPREQLPGLEAKVKEHGLGKVITPLVSLDTPGKATVEVVILADPDGHEICFVGDEAYRLLSVADPAAPELLKTKIAEYKKHKASGKRF